MTPWGILFNTLSVILNSNRNILSLVVLVTVLRHTLRKVQLHLKIISVTFPSLIAFSVLIKATGEYVEHIET